MKTPNLPRPLVLKKPRMPPARPSVPPGKVELPKRQPLPLAVISRSGWPLNGYEEQQHVIRTSGILGDCQLYRCACGLLIIEHGANLYWVPVKVSMVRLENREQLATVLRYSCKRGRQAAQDAAGNPPNEPRAAKQP